MQAKRLFGIAFFSSLTRRIVFLNLAALAALVIGVLYLNQWREGLIDVRTQSLRVQGEIIAAAIAASATIDSDVISINPDRLVEFQSGAPLSPLSFFDPSLEFPINPERVAPLLGNLVIPTNTRARIYDKDGLLIVDSNNIYTKGQVFTPPLNMTDKPERFFLINWWNRLIARVSGSRYALYREFATDEGKKYPEVSSAIIGAPAQVVRVDEHGQLIISVAVPIKRLSSIVGVLLLSTSPGDIDAIVIAERLSVLRLALIAALVTSILSFLLAGTIAGPIRRLSAAAKKAQKSLNDRSEIPDFTYRGDEIGDLSNSLRSMLDALYDRIEAIEKFAADVAHELKNPLTSLRSAVETLSLASSKTDKERLTKIILHDVKRLDRLISDISNISRLDAELARQSAIKVDIVNLLETMVMMQQEIAKERDVELSIDIANAKNAFVFGHDSRLAQVITNLLENAISFSPKGGKVNIDLSIKGDEIIIKIADEGTGIIGDKNRIFNRFYTDRPKGEAFGNHSGLGLSISKQIIEAHKGSIKADNKKNGKGAIFSVILPKAK